jgi:hypothetical protein
VWRKQILGEGKVSEEVEEYMARILNLCEAAPDAGLELIDQIIRNKPELGLNPFVRFAKAIAYGSKGLFKLLRNKPGIDWTAFDKEELRENIGITDAHLDYLELALQEIRKMEEIQSEALKVFVIEHEMGRAKVDAIAMVLERCRPGRVQELLGKTKLLYFPPSRVFIHNDCKITKEEFFVFRDIFFTPSKLAKSAILRLDGIDNRGRRYVVVVLYEEANPFVSEFADSLCLYDDRTWSTFPPGR